MSSPTASKVTATATKKATITETEIHQASHSPPPGSPPPGHRPSPTVAYGDEKHSDYEKSGEHIVDMPPSHDDPATPLNLFQSALGIPPPKKPKTIKPSWWRKKTPHPIQPDKPSSRLTAKNKGVYNQVLSLERTSHWKYLFCEFTVTIAMFLQIVVGASVTAFGAGQSSHVLITCFGAANTALASLLAVLKSQGLPNRIRQDWNAWRELREFIEEKERQIEMEDSKRIEGVEVPNKLNVWQTVQEIEKLYRDTRANIETNRPDTYVPVPKPDSSKKS
ncbi:hypothetical protein L207DRAFT_520181 [Hyaloscypha variabilis F]|uniref:SMODS and SLOG-associating 2TM effector domain-containing protein n=1 Tax=Hyaloscypha variabilis (strain UAMH 11265 / GT02V1 / F) TaxID=1149755 RepID=A0A2J6QVP7_HYAVF|nr:hypothetical protein L207DRAFT_520181 [Hyaloscypha variabilis F]